jgi:hypothetical protein
MSSKTQPPIQNHRTEQALLKPDFQQNGEQVPWASTALADGLQSPVSLMSLSLYPNTSNLRRQIVDRLQRRHGNGCLQRILARQLLAAAPPVANSIIARPIVQRQAAGDSASVDINTWPTVIPDAPVGTKVTVVPGQAGKDPTVAVNMPRGSETGENSDEEADPMRAQVESLCGQIRGNRLGINERFMTRQLYTIRKQTGNFGYMYTPQQEKFAKNADAANKSAANDYLMWLTSAEPAALKEAGGVTNLTGKLKAQFELWQDIGNEGPPTAMNTWDGENVTWGRGFSASGQLQEMMAAVFKIDPAIGDEFLKAGITLEGGQFLVVDVDRQLKYRDDNAEHVIQVDRKLVSLFVNIAESPAHRQAILDANWRKFVAGTGNIPNSAVGWDRRARAVAGHNIHGGHFTWSSFTGTSGTLAEIVAVVGRKFGKATADQAIIVPPWVTEKRLKNLANGWALQALEGPVRWGRTYVGPPTENPPDPKDKPELWQQSGFAAGQMYFAVDDGNAYYVLNQ